MEFEKSNMSYLQYIEQQRNKYKNIIEVIGDNNAKEYLESIDSDNYLVQLCDRKSREYKKKFYSRKEVVMNNQIQQLKNGNKIVLRGW